MTTRLTEPGSCVPSLVVKEAREVSEGRDLERFPETCEGGQSRG